MEPAKASSTNTATWRTSVNLTILTAVAGLIFRLTGKEIDFSEQDVLILAPVVGVAGGIFYRLSRAVVDKFPVVGYVLFGTKKEPVAYASPAPEPDDIP